MLYELLLELIAMIPAEEKAFSDAIAKVHAAPNGAGKLQAGLAGAASLVSALSSAVNT